jgi:Flp pilus assembly protein TadD
MGHDWKWGVVFVWLLACSGAQQSAAPAAQLPDEPSPPPRAVPKASQLVKDGEAKLQAKDVAGAKALFEQAIAEDPSDVRAHLDLGIVCELSGDGAGAEKAYRKAIELDASFAEALNNLGVLLRDRGDLDEASALLERAVAANPGSAAAHGNLALALEERKDVDGAERAYRKAIELDPKNAMLQANLGLLLIGKGDAAAAGEQLRAALAKAQGNRAALLTIGNGLRLAGDAQGALRAMQGAVEAEPEVTPALLAELALAQRATEDRDGAIATLERALSLDAKYATAHYLLGNLLAGAERFAEAKQHYDRYLALEPKGEHADKARERLKMLKKARTK